MLPAPLEFKNPETSVVRHSRATRSPLELNLVPFPASLDHNGVKSHTSAGVRP
jgi:hypothetical protein